MVPGSRFLAGSVISTNSSLSRLSFSAAESATERSSIARSMRPRASFKSCPMLLRSSGGISLSFFKSSVISPFLPSMRTRNSSSSSRDAVFADSNRSNSFSINSLIRLAPIKKRALCRHRARKIARYHLIFTRWGDNGTTGTAYSGFSLWVSDKGENTAAPARRTFTFLRLSERAHSFRVCFPYCLVISIPYFSPSVNRSRARNSRTRRCFQSKCPALRRR